MATHHRPAGRGGRRPGDAARTASTSTAPSAAAGMRARCWPRLSPRGRLIAIDRDPQAVAAATAGDRASTTRAFPSTTPASAHSPPCWRTLGVARIDGAAAGPGRLVAPDRRPGARIQLPLRRAAGHAHGHRRRGESAADFLARADERHIAEVIRDYGEERFAVPVAKALVARREGGNPVRTTRELSDVVARAVKTREPGQDPATRTFQALRIFVNAELEELEQGLSARSHCWRPSGRLVVISFHSLEDRIVKTFIARESRSEVDRRAPFAPAKPHAPEGARAHASRARARCAPTRAPARR